MPFLASDMPVGDWTKEGDKIASRLFTHVYTAERSSKGVLLFVIAPDTLKKTEVPLSESLAICSRSPDGFEWGYMGSGPHQLSVALLYRVTRNKDVAIRNHAEFTRDVIGTAPRAIKTLGFIGRDVSNWLYDMEKERASAGSKKVAA